MDIESVCAQIDDTFSLYDIESCEARGDFVLQSLVNGFSRRIDLIRKEFPAQNSNYFGSMTLNIPRHGKLGNELQE